MGVKWRNEMGWGGVEPPPHLHIIRLIVPLDYCTTIMKVPEYYIHYNHDVIL